MTSVLSTASIRRWRLARGASACVVALAAACSPPPASAKAPESPAQAQPKPWTERTQTLRFQNWAGPFVPLWSGEYSLELSAPGYAANCRFRVPEDSEALPADPGKLEQCRGDQVHLYWGPASVIGITLPARAGRVKVRLLRGASVVHDGEVSAATSCEDFVAKPQEVRVCLFVQQDEVAPDAESAGDSSTLPPETP